MPLTTLAPTGLPDATASAAPLDERRSRFAYAVACHVIDKPWAGQFRRLAVDFPTSVDREHLPRWLPLYLSRLSDEAVAAYICALERWLVSAKVLRGHAAFDKPVGQLLMDSLVADETSTTFVDLDSVTQEALRFGSWLKRFSEGLDPEPAQASRTKREGAQ